MSTNTERQTAFKARMREQGKRQLTLWVTPQQAEAIKAFVGRSVAPPPLAGRLDSEPAEPLPVTLPTGEVVAAHAPVREALAEGLEPRFKKAVLPAYGEGWKIFLGPHPVGQVWKAKSGNGWEGRQTLRVSLLESLSPHQARTRQQVTRAVLASLEL